MKKLLIALLFVPAVAGAGDYGYRDSLIDVNLSIEELIAAVKKVPELEKRIEALEKRVNDLPRLTLPDDTHSWTLTPN